MLRINYSHLGHIEKTNNDNENKINVIAAMSYQHD